MTKQTNEFQPRMLRMGDLTKYCALSRAYIYQKIKEGNFPEGHMLSPGIRAFEKSEIDAWLDQRMGKAT
jgi:predicted DNA-binding transcriptional regulator AlpA